MSYITPVSRMICKPTTEPLSAPIVRPSGLAFWNTLLAALRPPPPSIISTIIVGLPGIYLLRYFETVFTRKLTTPPGSLLIIFSTLP